jgi:hypothetical protein
VVLVHLADQLRFRFVVSKTLNKDALSCACNGIVCVRNDFVVEENHCYRRYLTETFAAGSVTKSVRLLFESKETRWEMMQICVEQRQPTNRIAYRGGRNVRRHLQGIAGHLDARGPGSAHQLKSWPPPDL